MFFGHYKYSKCYTILLVAISFSFLSARAEESAPDRVGAGTPGLFDHDLVALHAQTTFVFQGHDGFRAPYSGPQSLDRAARGNETWDLTLYGGVHPWKGGEIWVDGEVDQGFGLSNTMGMAGFASGEAYKVGRAVPYFRVQRAFFRQTVNFGGGKERVSADLNQFRQEETANRLVVTAGKFSVPDVFDNNDVAHDPRADFLNWSFIDTGTYDYAADSWGYTVGAAAEWYQGDWVLRSGAFLMSDQPNSPDIDTSFRQFQANEEVEHRHRLWGREGHIALTFFLTHARMGRFRDAVRLAEERRQPAELADIRHVGNRPGVSLNIAQNVTDELDVFLRMGWADGHVESYEFTDIDRSVAGGLSLKGTLWKRDADRFGLAVAFNEASRARRAYLAAGGLGLLVGDGKLPHSGAEHILETYYDVALWPNVHMTLDYQWAGHPAYNRDRGPVSIVGVRLHAQI